mmetsp:Transcript_4350/g.11789  ORF Transcript_4350/g.11789 Transcript_4350/m.11789 type:complete len:89 (+) Transcript_4350:1020-1286(+)
MHTAMTASSITSWASSPTSPSTSSVWSAPSSASPKSAGIEPNPQVVPEWHQAAKEPISGLETGAVSPQLESAGQRMNIAWQWAAIENS